MVDLLYNSIKLCNSLTMENPFGFTRTVYLYAGK